MHRDVFLERGFVETFHHVGPHEAGGDGVDRHFLARDFLSERLGGGNQAAFGGGIVRLSRQTFQAGERGDVDDAAAFFQEHGLEDGAGHVVEAVERGGEHFVPVIGLHPDEQAVAADAGVVDQHLDEIVGMAFLPSLDGCAYGRRIGDVERQQAGFSSAGFNQRGCLPGFLFVGHIVDEDAVTRAGEAERCGAADAAAGAGDECVVHRMSLRALQVLRAETEVPRMPCRPRFCPVRKSHGRGVCGAR